MCGHMDKKKQKKNMRIRIKSIHMWISFMMFKYSLLPFKDALDAVDELLQHTFQYKVAYNTY